jgi:methionyl-tRNA formyltransferase
VKLGFAGTPDFGNEILSSLVLSEHEIQVVFTQPDAAAGRRRRLTPSPVRSFAESHGLDVRTPLNAWNKADVDALRGVDTLIVAAYGQILPQVILDVPLHGCINVHASLLPRWRGAAPVERAIMAGDKMTGISIMRMDVGLDTGPVLSRHPIPILESDSGPELNKKLAKIGAKALIDCLSKLDVLDAVIQDGSRATYAAKITAEDAAINWTESAEAIARQVRALTQRQTAHANIGKERVNVIAASADMATGTASAIMPGTMIKVAHHLAVACGEGALLLDSIQLTRGKGRILSARDAKNGYPALFEPGIRFDVTS